MKLIIKKKHKYKIFSLKQYAENRNNILFVRQVGGLGDIFMHCMMFEDIKSLSPDIKITWAVPNEYMCVAKMHKFVDEVVDVRLIDLNNYLIHYDTTRACMEYEMSLSPYADKHRSDIWANHCGVYLKNHNLNLELPNQYIEQAENYLHRKNVHNYPVLFLSPVSSTIAKDLNSEHLMAIADFAKQKNIFVIASHTTPLLPLRDMGMSLLHGLSIPQWMGFIQAADYVVSVDTSTVHYAGAIGKPTVGVFTYADGKVYGRYNSKFVLVQKHRDDKNWNCGPCYNWGVCPKSDEPVKPCLTEITPKMLISGINKLLEKFPI
jgi:ADP-heptose:LPS heptosyltransferase